ncbi:MAG: molecular chaperone DnaJ [Deltaproteobacteria bacterium]|nr:molecular chaperone DnaJ [Deltaproteobacteria bacterium]
MYNRSDDSCVMCGGDGRIGNAFGATKTCPSCHGSGRKMEDYGARDVTKTKSPQGRGPNAVAIEKEIEAAKKHTAPRTQEGKKLADEIKACAIIDADTKTRLFNEIVAYEASHGQCTRTFSKKVRKQLRGTTSST